MNKLQTVLQSNLAKNALRSASVLAVSIIAAAPAAAQALQPIVKASNIAQATVVAIALAILTVSWGLAGYKMAFGGAGFRDVAGPMIGGAIAGAAAAVAAVFIG